MLLTLGSGYTRIGYTTFSCFKELLDENDRDLKTCLKSIDGEVLCLIFKENNLIPTTISYLRREGRLEMNK